MAVPQQNVSSVRELRTVQGSARELLRYVDRAALDELTRVFVEAVGLPAMVLTPAGEFIAGTHGRCPACDDETIDRDTATLKMPALDSSWVRCGHGPRHLIIPISGRTGTPLAAVAVGPLVVADSDAGSLRRVLVARGDNERRARERAGKVARSTPSRVEAAAHLLAQTLDIVVREAAIASENADRAASQRLANRELTVLYSVVRALGAGIELRAILQQLVDAVVAMLGCDVALVGLVEGDELVTVASAGHLTREAKNGRLKIGEGLAGRVAATGESLTCRDMQDDPRQYLTAINSREELHAFAGVPLTSAEGTFGVLAIYRRMPHSFPDSELHLLEHIAAQVAVAMERTRLYEQELRTIGELRALHDQIERQHRALERATAVHDQLTQMVLQDAGLEAIVDSLAQILAAPVEVEDQFHQNLARAPRPGSQNAQEAANKDHSQSAAARDREELRQLFATVREHRGPVSFPAAPALGYPHPRVVAPVIVGGDVLGYLSVTERERALEESDLLALSHASTVIALEMMKQRTRAEVERRLRGELLDELVSGKPRDAEAMQRRAAYLGYNLATPHALLFIAPNPADKSSPAAPPAQNEARLPEALERLTGTTSTGAMAVSRADGMLVAIPLRDGAMAEARRIAETLRLDAERAVSSPVLVAIGRICRAPEDFAVSVREAERAVALARSLGATDRVIVFEDLGVYRLLLDLPRPSDAGRFAEELLAPLQRYDSRHEAKLMDTLEAYLAANGIQQRAAEMLSVHVNTLVYRLQRIRDLTGIDLQDSDARLGLHLAVKIRQAVAVTLGENPR